MTEPGGGGPRDVTLGQTTFRIGLLLPEEAFDLLEEIRPGLQPALSRITIPDNLFAGTKAEAKARIMGLMAQLMATMATTVPPEVVKKARTVLFRHVTFTSPTVTQPAVVANDLGAAFDPSHGMDAAHIYIILGRAFWRNFTGSFDVLQSLIED